MPSQKTILNLEQWSDALTKERPNDYEYNQLLFQFRSFYNEVKEYQELHNNCSVTRASRVEPPTFGPSIKNATGSASEANTINFKVLNSPATNFNKLPFRNQHSIDVGHNGVSRSPFLKQDQLNNINSRHQDIASNVQHYNSSYNLPTLSSHNSSYGLNRPEIRQRNQIANSRLLFSKSSERLDAILNSTSTNDKPPHVPSLNNNHEDKKYKPITSVQSVARNKYSEDDDNIYDAVSPDDILGQHIDLENHTASSVHNLNRLSLPHKNKLESSKSSPVFNRFNINTGKDNFNYARPIPNSKQSSNWKDEEERNNNSFSSSVVLGTANSFSTSSLSLLATSNDNNKSNNSNSIINTSNEQDQSDYANYVNIDFFLKRSHSPSCDGLEEDATTTHDESSDNSDTEDTTQLSHSLSSDQICEDVLQDMSPSELAKRLFHKAPNNDEPSANSMTPASSGDLLDEHRGSFNHINQKNPQSMQSASSKRSNFFGNKVSSFLFHNSQESATKASTSPRESTSLKSSPQHQTLNPITEHAAVKHSMSLDSNQIGERDGSALVEAHNTMRSFLSDLNLSPIDDVFEDKAQRRIVKESFAVEFCGRRKLRHLFLFNDVMVCAKYQASSKQKFTFDVKWYLNLNGISILDPSEASNQIKYDKEAIDNQILAIRTNLMLLRGQMQHIKRSKHKQPSRVIKKLKKKRTELEAELVLLLPHLPLVIKHINGKKYTFFLSSNFDRNQWVETIKFLQSQLPATKGSLTTPSSNELQAWIETCRKNLNPSLGTFLLRSNCDDDLLYGDLYITLESIQGISKVGNYYFCFEVDSYGHFSQKASSPVLRIDNPDHELNEEYVFPLDGAHTLRVLLYEDLGSNSKSSVIGKAHIELSRGWFLDKPVIKTIVFNSNFSLKTQLSYSSSELLSMRIPHAKLCPTFGMDITQVCKREKTNVPLLIQLCVNEVERRGMREVGIYRMSGTSTDIQRLKKAFETNPYVAELLLRDIDVNSVTGFLKTYLREMPEGLFSNKLYLKLVAAFNIPQSETLERTKTMLDLFHKMPVINQNTIIHLVEHLVKVNKFENYNKMSLTNLATVIGPNILRPPTDSSGAGSSDPFTAVVIGSMSQAGILYFFLNRKFCNLPLTELDPSELTNRNASK